MKPNKAIIFTQGYMGELFCEKVMGLPCTFYTYSHNSLRSKSDQAFLREGLPFRYISEKSFEPDKISIPRDSFILCVNWTKDFFHNSKPEGVPIYHIHPSLLPKFRGYGAVSEQFLTGTVASGISLYEDNGSVDGGDLLCQEQIQIEFNDYPKNFMSNCSKVAVRWLQELFEDTAFQRKSQNNNEATYCRRYRNNNGLIDFNTSALYVYNHIRAFSFPFFGAFFYHEGQKIVVWEATCEKWTGNYGKPSGIINKNKHGVEIACGDGTILITKAQIDEKNYIFQELSDHFNL